MSRFGGAVVLAVAVVAGFVGCGSGAVGIDECRTIEQARCQAAVNCDVGIDSSSDEDTCNRYARDNCLHGLPTDPPRESTFNRCVAAIKAAGTCARKQGGNTRATDCSGLTGSFAEEKTTVCDVVQDPEDASECAFLTDKPVQPAEAGVSTKTDAGDTDGG
jgi:hypothetical protein